MSTLKKLSALIGAGALVFAMVGSVSAHAGNSVPENVAPVTTDPGQINPVGEGGDDADCALADTIKTGNSGGQDTTDNGVTVTWTYDGTTKAAAFTASGGLVTIAYIKGGNGYNTYDYTGKAGGGVAADGHLHAPDNGGENGAGLSHAVFCTVDVEETGAPSQDTEDITESPTDGLLGNGTSSPADGAWLLVVALGALLASVVVLTPARAKSRR